MDEKAVLATIEANCQKRPRSDPAALGQNRSRNVGAGLEKRSGGNPQGEAPPDLLPAPPGDGEHNSPRE